ncbi:hypothetical protein B0T25DRAFT_451503, partial [Lasiosphaeria hispida]
TCTPRGVRASWEECNDILGRVKKIDVFGPACIDSNVPVEVTIGALKQLQDEGKIGAAGLSEVRAETVKRASAVCPIAYAEVEFSLWSTEILDNGVALAATELCSACLPCVDNSFVKNFTINLDILDKVQAFAKKKGYNAAHTVARVKSYSNFGL